MIDECPQCGATMNLIDETTKLTEYRCPECYYKEIEWKDRDDE